MGHVGVALGEQPGRLSRRQFHGGIMNRTGIVWVSVFLAFAGTAWAQQQKEHVQPADVYVRTAKIALKEKDFKRAEINLTTCLENYPENYEAHYLMGAIWAEKDEIDSMMTHFTLARQYAGAKMNKKDLQSMEDIEQSKWLASFNNGVSYINLADSLEEAAGGTDDVAAGQQDRERNAKVLDEAAKAFRNCTVIRPTEFRGWFNYGMVFDRERDYTKAAEIYRQSEDLFHRYQFEDSTTNFYDTTLFCQGAGQVTPLFEELINKFKKMKDDQRTRYKGLLTALGGVYFELKQFENCIAVFRRLLGFYEEDLGALEYIGNSFQQLGNQEEALKWTEFILTKNPDDKDRLYNVGVHWYNDGVDAKKKHENILKEKLQGSKDPNIEDEITKTDEHFQRSFTNALGMFDRVLQLDPNDKDTWKLKGVTLFFLEKCDEAIPVLEKVRAMLPDENKAICQYLRECYRKKGDSEKVLKLTEECGL